MEREVGGGGGEGESVSIFYRYKLQWLFSRNSNYCNGKVEGLVSISESLARIDLVFLKSSFRKM